MSRAIYQELVFNKAARDGVLMTLRMMGVTLPKRHHDIEYLSFPDTPAQYLERALKKAVLNIQMRRLFLREITGPGNTAGRLQVKIKDAWGNHLPKLISGVNVATPNTPDAGMPAAYWGGTILLTSRWHREVHKRGLQMVDGVVVLDATHISTGGRVALFNATWIRKGRGGFTKEDGVIAQDTVNGTAMYGSTVKGAKKALTNEIRRQVVERLTDGVTDPRAAIPV